ncbi:MAG: endonuclease domain-containing protein [Oscillospiraceae bacterium]|nr:endonuclease domain-containing protein [Oscillospiraceae bacterium]
MALNHNSALVPFAKELRKNMTREERHLWYDYLRNYPMRFRRQEVIGRFIVDFYCDTAKLAIELDGSQHYEKNAALYDAERSEYLNSLGIQVLRFSNLEIQRSFSAVCDKIDDAIQASPLREL